MYKVFYLFFLVFPGISIYSETLKTVSAEYIYYAPETMPVIEAKRIALERAKIKAIEDAFGSIVSQTSATAILTTNGESASRFFAIGGCDIKGEWIETIGDPIFGDIYYQDNMLVVPCSVKGRARKYSHANINFTAIPLRNGIEAKFESYQFKEGDELYFYFKSPVDGYLAIYLVDEMSQIVYCALPYRNSNGFPKKVEADKEYVLFSKKSCDVFENGIVDEYVMTVTEDMEYNDFYVLFSPEQFAKATLQEEAFNLPKTINWNDFQKWLSQTRVNNSNLSLSKILITISR